MRIVELKTFVVGNPPPTFGGRYFLFLKLVADNGIEGLGEVYAASFGPNAIVAMIEDVFEHHVLGADPFQIEMLWRNVYGRGYSGRPDISLMGVLSGIEMAMWDLVGKAVEQTGLRAARRQGPREAAQLYLSLSRRRRGRLRRPPGLQQPGRRGGAGA